MNKVDLFAKTDDGRWVCIFKDIDEEQANAIWMAGFKTGQNRFSIHKESMKKIIERNEAMWKDPHAFLGCKSSDFIRKDKQ